MHDKDFFFSMHTQRHSQRLTQRGLCGNVTLLSPVTISSVSQSLRLLRACVAHALTCTHTHTDAHTHWPEGLPWWSSEVMMYWVTALCGSSIHSPWQSATEGWKSFVCIQNRKLLPFQLFFLPRLLKIPDLLSQVKTILSPVKKKKINLEHLNHLRW